MIARMAGQAKPYLFESAGVPSISPAVTSRRSRFAKAGCPKLGQCVLNALDWRLEGVQSAFDWVTAKRGKPLPVMRPGGN
jgi:hypothetical protein